MFTDVHFKRSFRRKIETAEPSMLIFYFTPEKSTLVSQEDRHTRSARDHPTSRNHTHAVPFAFFGQSVCQLTQLR